MTKASKIREIIAKARAHGAAEETVIQKVMDQIGFTRQLARAYVKNNWDKAVEAPKPSAAKKAEKAAEKKLAERRAKDAERKRQKRAAEKAAKAAPLVQAEQVTEGTTAEPAVAE